MVRLLERHGARGVGEGGCVNPAAGVQTAAALQRWAQAGAGGDAARARRSTRVPLIATNAAAGTRCARVEAGAVGHGHNI